MVTKKIRSLSIVMFLFIAGMVVGDVLPSEQSWVAKSDVHTQFLLDNVGRYAPESFGQLGGKGLDEMITELSEEFDKKALRAFQDVLVEIAARQKRETHPSVKQDLGILTDFLEQTIEDSDLNDRLLLPYRDPVELIFMGVRLLLDDQVTEARRPAALVRLRRYTGLEKNWTSVLKQAEENLRRAMRNPGLLGPFRGKVELDLKLAPQYIAGIAGLLKNYKISDGAETLSALEKQVKAWDDFVRRELLPRARQDHRLPPELYRLKLKTNGIDMPLEELVNRSQATFREIQNEMRVIAALVAEKRGWPERDYRRVIQELKKEQLAPEKAVARYRERIDFLARLAGEEKLVTFPSRDMLIRLATEAESAVMPGPSMKLPPLLGNTGEMGEFIIALGRGGGQKIDDFTHEAATWSLAAHEGRPGHEMQITRALENGISMARALFGLNTANLDGWALYIEAELKPFFPLEGQLISLQFRLMRAARGFLDPGVQSGDILPDAAMRVLTRDVVLSEPLAQQELERYMDSDPGQAAAYFCGYARMMELRAEVERRLGEKFDQKKYHDFLMGIGPLPMVMVHQILLEDFVPAMLGRRKAG